jgi:hypothetical protein
MAVKCTSRWASRKLHRLALGAILCGYVVLAAAYSISTPLFETYDERFHFAYVLSLALDHGLPVQNVQNPGPWGNEGSQPPLYYLLASAVSFWTANPNLQAQIVPNPYATRHQAVEQDDNRNYFVHNKTEDFPYQGNVLALHLARWVSVLFGALGIAATYWTGRQVWPALPAVALGAAAFQAFIPSYVHVTASASNDAAVIGLSSLALGLIAAVIRARSVSRRRAAILGLLIGLATLAKLSALPLLGVGMLAVFWAAGAIAHWPQAVRRCAACLAAFTMVVGWWTARNWILYGELLGTDTMNRIAGLRLLPPSGLQLWDEIRLEIERNFWAAFGSGNIHPPDIWLSVPRAIALTGLIGCLFVLLRARRERRMSKDGEDQRRVLILLAMWVGALVVSLAWWLLHVERVTGRLLYPALTPLSLAVAVGWARLPAMRWRPWAVAFVGVAMFALSSSLLFVSLRPAYARPPSVNMAEAASAPSASDLVFGDSIRLWGFSVREKSLQPGGLIHVDYYWQALAPLLSDYTVFTHILGPGDQAIGGTDSLPGRGLFPTIDWNPGQIYKDTMSVYLDSPPGEVEAGTIVVGWYDTNTKKALGPRAPDGSHPRVSLGQIRVAPAAAPVYQPSHSVAANFGGQVNLIGYDIGASNLTLYWSARVPMTANYTVFVHVLDEQGKIVAQADAQPRGGAYPTALWEAGEVVKDTRAVQLPAAYAGIRVGLYRLETGERLRLEGQTADSVMVVESR